MKYIIILLLLCSCNVEKTLERKMRKTVDFATKHKMPCKCEYVKKNGDLVRTLNVKQ